MSETSRSINVSLKVIADLSQGLYRSPADALKELVSNAYDADSPKVEINFERDFSAVTIRDWGRGISIDEFIETMETIGGSSKRLAGKNDTTPSGRKIVGRIGIGLLSVSQIANLLEIESTVSGSDLGFHAKVEFNQFASEDARKIKITELWEKNKYIEIGKYYYEEIRGVDKKQHFTTLKLSGLKRTIAEKLTAGHEKDGHPRMLGKELYSITELIQWMGKKSVTKTGLHEYDRIFFELCTLCPVPYLNNPLTIRNHIKNSSRTEDFLNFVQSINKETHLELIVDGIKCFKPLLMPSENEKNYPLFFNLIFMKGLNDEVVSYKDYDRNGTLVEKQFRVRGYLYFQRPKVWPPELQGLIIRVRNVAVGQYDSTFMTYRRHEGFKFSQITGEILVDGLDDALNIDRSSLRETEPVFVAFREAIHNYLSRIVFPGIKSYAGDERAERREKIFSKEAQSLQKRFKSIDSKQRKITFKEDQSKLLERTGSEISLGFSVNGKKQKIQMETYRTIAFLDSYLSGKLTVEERDELFKKLSEWLTEFE